MNLSAVLVALVPPDVVTVTSTVPVPAGEVILMEVPLLTVRLVPAVVPNLTPVAPLRLVPVMVTTVPPPAGPLLGLMPLTVGAATCVFVINNPDTMGVPIPVTASQPLLAL